MEFHSLLLSLAVVLMFGLEGCVGQNYLLHLSSVEWASSNVSHTSVSQISVECKDSFTSKWNSFPGLTSLDAGTNYTNNDTSTLFSYTFGNPQSILTLNSISCRERVIVNSATRTQDLGTSCGLDPKALQNNLDVHQCCSVSWDDGLNARFCVVARLADGVSCANDVECDSQSCRNGKCCGALGNVDGCTSCTATAGKCDACGNAFFLHSASSGARRRRRHVSTDKNNNYVMNDNNDNGIVSDDEEESAYVSRSRRGASASTGVVSNITITAPMQVEDSFTMHAAGPNLDVNNLPLEDTCYLRQVAGATCNVDAHCASGKCREGNCCNATLYTSSCRACSSMGACTRCSGGFELKNGMCSELSVDGVACTTNDECSSKDCRGGRCCGAKGQSTGCLECDQDGECNACDTSFNRVLFECVVDLGQSSSPSKSLSNVGAIGIGVGVFLAVIIIAVLIQRARISQGDASGNVK
eukprot:m.79944 g.79944  ORF g.79944 m.79944 type:complete len:470 (-) comp8616_c8_seq2:753-2162(-)